MDYGIDNNEASKPVVLINFERGWYGVDTPISGDDLARLHHGIK